MCHMMMPVLDSGLDMWEGQLLRRGNGRRLKLVGDIPTWTTHRLTKNIPMCLIITWGKNPMTRTQWRRHQRNKKVASETASASKNNSVKALDDGQKEKKHVKQRLFTIITPVVENELKVSIGSYEEIANKDFNSRSEGDSVKSSLILRVELI